MSLFNRKLTVAQWIIISLLIALVVMSLLYTCEKRKKCDTGTPFTEKEKKEILQPVIKDSVDRKKIVDSVKKTFASVAMQVKKLSDENKLLQESINSQSEIISELLTSRVGDNEYEGSVLDRYNNLTRDYRKKDSTCNYILGLKDLQLSIKDSQISQGDSLYANVRKAMDSVLAAKGIVKTEKIRNKLAVGFIGNFFPDAGIGAGATFIQKKGWIFETNVLRMNNTWYYMGGVKKVISFGK